MSEQKEKTRVAITRCDSHAYWFGVVMDEPDMEVLRTSNKQAPTRESVHYYLRDGANPNKLKIELVPGFVISKVYDKVDRLYGDYPGRAEEFCRTFPSGPKVCDDFNDLLVDIDAAFVADSSGPPDGADHLELARPFLENGIPVCVDKPFASTYADAYEMVRLARENDTPLMNASILSHTDTREAFRRRFAEIGEPGMIVVNGVGPGNSGTMHGLALAQGLVGYGVDWVECIGSHENECIQLHYPSDLEAFVISGPVSVFPRNSFWCSAYSKLGAIHSPAVGDWEYDSGTRRIVEMFRLMIDTGKPPVPYERLLESVAIIEAATIAQREGRRVMLSEIYEE